MDTLGRYELQSFAKTLSHDFRCFDFMSLDVDHSNAKLEPVRKLFEQLQIFAAAPRKLERKLMYSCFENGRKEIPVIPSPRRFSISIAVADVERDLGVDAFNKRVDDPNAPLYILGKKRRRGGGECEASSR